MNHEYVARYAALYREHWWWRARERLIVDEVGRLLRRDGSARILDVGCGAGLLFPALAPFGEVQGVESDALAAEQSGALRGRIWIGSFDDYHPPGRFDLVIMADVLEHLPEPVAALRKAGSLLAPGGQLLVTVPAFRWLWTLHDEINGHVTRYSASELSAVATEAGLQTTRVRYFFGWLVLPKLAVRLHERVRRMDPRLPAVPAGWVNEALIRLSLVENRLFGERLPAGSSLLAVCAPVPHA